MSGLVPDLESLGAEVRLRLGIPNDERPDAIDLLRRAQYGKLIKSWRVLADDALPRADAMWDDDKREIVLRESVILRLERGDVDARFTIFHELAHAILNHRQRNRGTSGNRTQFGRFVEADEREADALAAVLLAPEELAVIGQDTKADRFAARFRMPHDKAAARLEDLKRRQRKRLGLARELPSGAIDTGDYAQAMREMAANARRWNF